MSDATTGNAHETLGLGQTQHSARPLSPSPLPLLRTPLLPPPSPLPPHHHHHHLPSLAPSLPPPTTLTLSPGNTQHQVWPNQVWQVWPDFVFKVGRWVLGCGRFGSGPVPDNCLGSVRVGGGSEGSGGPAGVGSGAPKVGLPFDVGQFDSGQWCFFST